MISLEVLCSLKTFLRHHLLLSAVPVAKRGWIVPTPVESVESFKNANMTADMTEDNEYDEET